MKKFRHFHDFVYQSFSFQRFQILHFNLCRIEASQSNNDLDSQSSDRTQYRLNHSAIFSFSIIANLFINLSSAKQSMRVFIQKNQSSFRSTSLIIAVFQFIVIEQTNLISSSFSSSCWWKKLNFSIIEFINLTIFISERYLLASMSVSETQSTTEISVFKSTKSLKIRIINFSNSKRSEYNHRTPRRLMITFLIIKSSKIDKSQSRFVSSRFFIVFYFKNISRQRYNQFKREIRIQQRNFFQIIFSLQEFLDNFDDEYLSSSVSSQFSELSLDLNCSKFSLKPFSDTKCLYFVFNQTLERSTFFNFSVSSSSVNFFFIVNSFFQQSWHLRSWSLQSWRNSTKFFCFATSVNTQIESVKCTIALKSWI